MRLLVSFDASPTPRSCASSRAGRKTSTLGVRASWAFGPTRASRRSSKYISKKSYEKDQTAGRCRGTTAAARSGRTPRRRHRLYLSRERPHRGGLGVPARAVPAAAEEDEQVVLAPQLTAGKPRALHQRFELRPHDRRMDAAVKRPLREAAVGAGDHVFAPEHAGEAHDALVRSEE